MVEVGSPLVPFVPVKRDPLVRVEDGPRQTPLHVRTKTREGTNEPDPSNPSRLRPVSGIMGFQAPVNHGFLTQVMTEEQSAAAGQSTAPSS